MKYKNKTQPQSLCRRLAGCRGPWCFPQAPALDVCLRTLPDPPRDPLAQAGARAGGPCRAPALQARLSAVCWAGCEHPAVLTASSCAYSIQLCLQHPPSWGKCPCSETCSGTATAPGKSEIPCTGSCGPAFLRSALLFPAPHTMSCLCIHGDTPWDPGECPKGLAPLPCAPAVPQALGCRQPGSWSCPLQASQHHHHGIMKSSWLAEITKSNIPPNTPMATDPWPEVTHLPMSGAFPGPPTPCSLLCLMFLWLLPHNVPWAIPFLTTNYWLLLPSFNSGFSIHLLSLSWLPPLSPRMLSLVLSPSLPGDANSGRRAGSMLTLHPHLVCL